MPNRAIGKGPLLLAILVVLGLVAGSLLSQLLRPYLPFLGRAVTVGFEPRSPLLLGDIFSFSLGFRLRLDLATMCGLILALILYRRM